MELADSCDRRFGRKKSRLAAKKQSRIGKNRNRSSEKHRLGLEQGEELKTIAQSDCASLPTTRAIVP
jgi:hypothetical protein